MTTHSETEATKKVRILLNALSDAGCALHSAVVALRVRIGYENLDLMAEHSVRVIESSTTLFQAYIVAANVLNSDEKLQDLKNIVFETITGLNAAAISLIAKRPTIESLEAASHKADITSATAHQTKVRFSDTIYKYS
jgi:hypothetical protein